MIKRINDSAYVLNLLESFDVCPIFNIEYLVAYKVRVAIRVTFA